MINSGVNPEVKALYLAELHGKLSSRAEGQEDVLTSNVFSFFKYADRKRFLWPFLKETLGLSVSERDAEKAIFHFWPRFEDGTEPDLVLIVGDYYLLFEAKLYADFAPETKTIKAQLDRELEAGQKEAQTYKKSFKLIALTRDHFYRPEKFAHIPDDCFRWLSWQKVAFFISECLQANDLSGHEKLFANDLYRLLDRRRLRDFQGWLELARVELPRGLETSVFFNAKTASYRGAFIGFRESLSVEGPIYELKTPLFLTRTFFRTMPTGLEHEASQIFLRKGQS
jgi:hypothetical protein